MAVTLREVALRAGVDISTVSRVLSGDLNFSVRPDTRERIVRAAAELQYRPNAIARSLKTKSTQTLGMLIPDITNPLFSAIYKGAEDAAREAGYFIIMVNTGSHNEHEASTIDLLRAKRVDGFILATALATDNAVAQLDRAGHPFVLVNRRSPAMRDRFVAPDDALGARLAVKHLIELGHKRIGQIAGPLYTETGLARFSTYRQCLQEHGLPYEAGWVQEADFREEAGYEAMAHLIETRNRPTAVFCANDLVAMGAIRCAVDRGLAVPRDMSVVGFNDLPFTDRLQPPLTTIHIPQYEMGATAARMLIQVMNGQPPDPPYWLITPELRVRASTCPPAQDAFTQTFV